MRSIFCDTSYYLAIINPSDAFHLVAVAASNSISRPIVTTAWVLQEIADGLAGVANRASAIALLSAIESDKDTHVVLPEPLLWRRGLDLYQARRDKAWSLTDCISFCVMEELGLNEALSADRHFEQAGYRAMLRTR